jgi:hypothetical protein
MWSVMADRRVTCNLCLLFANTNSRFNFSDGSHECTE